METERNEISYNKFLGFFQTDNDVVIWSLRRRTVGYQGHSSNLKIFVVEYPSPVRVSFSIDYIGILR